MDEHLLDIYARLNLHELLFEILYADMFLAAANPEARLRQFKTDLCDRLLIRAFPPFEIPISSSLHDHCADVARTFGLKVERRMREQTVPEDQSTHGE